MKNIDITCENKVLRIFNNITQVFDKITKYEVGGDLCTHI